MLNSHIEGATMNKQILLVEDNALVALLTEDIFSSILNDARFIHVHSLDQALQHIHYPFDLVICDLNMDNSTTDEVIDQVCASFSGSEVIFFSATLEKTCEEIVNNKRVLFMSKSEEFAGVSRWLKKIYKPSNLN